MGPKANDGDAGPQLSEIMQLKLELAEARTKLNEVSDENNRLTEERNKLKGNLRKAKSKMLDLKNRVRDAERERATIRVKMEALQIERNEYKNKSQNLLSKTEQLKEERDKLSTKVDEDNDSTREELKVRRLSRRRSSLLSSFSSMFSQSQSFGELSAGLGLDDEIPSSLQNATWQSSDCLNGSNSTMSQPTCTGSKGAIGHSMKIHDTHACDVNSFIPNSCSPSQTTDDYPEIDSHGSANTLEDVDNFFDNIQNAGNENIVCISHPLQDTFEDGVQGKGSEMKKSETRRMSLGSDAILPNLIQGIFHEQEEEFKGTTQQKRGREGLLKRRHSFDAFEKVMDSFLQEKVMVPPQEERQSSIDTGKDEELENIYIPLENLRRNSLTPKEA